MRSRPTFGGIIVIALTFVLYAVISNRGYRERSAQLHYDFVVACDNELMGFLYGIRQNYSEISSSSMLIVPIDRIPADDSPPELYMTMEPEYLDSLFNQTSSTGEDNGLSFEIALFFITAAGDTSRMIMDSPRERLNQLGSVSIPDTTKSAGGSALRWIRDSGWNFQTNELAILPSSSAVYHSVLENSTEGGVVASVGIPLHADNHRYEKLILLPDYFPKVYFRPSMSLSTPASMFYTSVRDSLFLKQLAIVENINTDLESTLCDDE